MSHPTQALGMGLLVVCIGLVFVLLVAEKIRPDVTASLRSHTTDAMAPVAELFSTPKQAIDQAGARISHFFHTYQENKQLKRDNAQLLKWQAVAHQYAQENEQLKKLLRVVPESAQHFISAHMVSAFGQGSKHVALISAGMEDGAKKHLAVIGTDGLIGRIIEVGEKNARVLLITDVNANIPVISERSGHKAIVTGHRGQSVLRLEFVDKPEELQVGDRLITSGDGGMIPRGIPVASITSIRGASVFATPLADMNRSSMVTIVDYRF